MPEPGRVGHRATVTFDLLGVPDQISVALYYDIGAHWGGVVNRSPLEVALWALVDAILAVTIVLAVIFGVGRIRGAMRGRTRA